MKFETHVAKYTDHEVFSTVYPKFPTVRLYENNQYALGIALHKWHIDDGSNKGYYLAVYIVCGFENTWEDIDLVNAYNILQSENETIKSFDTNTLEDCSYTDDSIVVYKFSVNVWRRVELTGKKTKKWSFVDNKPSKDDPSKIQRLLN